MTDFAPYAHEREYPPEIRSDAALIEDWQARPERASGPAEFERLSLLRCDLFSRLACPESIKGGKGKR